MEINSIVSMPDELHADSKILTAKDLYAAEFAFDSAFSVQLADGELIEVEQVFRLIPKRRMVVAGYWQGRPVVAKFFYDPRHAKRHLQKDKAGVELLKENKIPTPDLYYAGMSADKRMQVLIFERIFEAQNLAEVWRNKTSIDELMPILQNVIIELATQHVLGVMQQDMHLENFLLTKKKIYTLDGAQIELFPQLLPKKQSMMNLALFLAQLGVGIEHYQEALFRYYAKSRGWLLKNEDIIELFLHIKKYNEERWRRYQRKIFRNCTDFACLSHLQSMGMYDREYAQPEFLHFLKHPETAFAHPSVQVLKAGRSATVIKVNLDHRDLVVKRYNIKDFWHGVRRCLRTTRALKSWRLGQKLNLFYINTARPVAFIEKRVLGFRGASYYITDYVAGEHAGEFFKNPQAQPDKIAAMVKRICALLKGLAKLDITHGDLKITNILINVREQPVLIDLDGAAEHASLSSLRGAWRKEIKRFLRNFERQPAILKQFKALLGQK